jgi:hypothetical protein
MGWYLGHKGLLAPTHPSQCGHVARINRGAPVFRDFRDIKNYIRERFPKKEGEKTNNHR